MNLVRGSTDRLRLVWEGDYATGPDGTRYMIQTARPREEGTIYSATIRRPGALSFEVATFVRSFHDCPYGYAASRREAKRICEWDAWDLAGRPSP